MTDATPDPPNREAWTGERRVTLDLDDTTPLELFRGWHTLRDAGAHEIEARVSASGDGCHVRAWFDAEDIDERGVERLRYLAGDHPRRVRMDRKHHIKPGQVLFTRKPSGEAGPWHHNVDDAADELRARSRHYGLERWTR